MGMRKAVFFQRIKTFFNFFEKNRLIRLYYNLSMTVCPLYRQKNTENDRFCAAMPQFCTLLVRVTLHGYRKVCRSTTLALFPVVEEQRSFGFCNGSVDIHQVEFPGDLHVLHMEGCQIAAAVADRLVSKGNGLLHGDQLADDGEIADGRAAVEAVQRIATAGDGLLQQHPGAGALLTDDEALAQSSLQCYDLSGKGMRATAYPHKALTLVEPVGKGFVKG